MATVSVLLLECRSVWRIIVVAVIGLILTVPGFPQEISVGTQGIPVPWCPMRTRDAPHGNL